MFRQLKKLLSPATLGQTAEGRARTFLEKKGYRFLVANYRVRSGEVDLIMEDRDTVVFVEVKARTRSDYGRPEEFVTPRKQARVAKAAMTYLAAEKRSQQPLRFDVVALLNDDIQHIPNAFVPSRYFY